MADPAQDGDAGGSRYGGSADIHQRKTVVTRQRRLQQQQEGEEEKLEVGGTGSGSASSPVASSSGRTGTVPRGAAAAATAGAARPASAQYVKLRRRLSLATLVAFVSFALASLVLITKFNAGTLSLRGAAGRRLRWRKNTNAKGVNDGDGVIDARGDQHEHHEQQKRHRERRREAAGWDEGGRPTEGTGDTKIVVEHNGGKAAADGGDDTKKRKAGRESPTAIVDDHGVQLPAMDGEEDGGGAAKGEAEKKKEKETSGEGEGGDEKTEHTNEAEKTEVDTNGKTATTATSTNVTNNSTDNDDGSNETHHDRVLAKSFVDLRNKSLPENANLLLADNDFGTVSPRDAAKQIMARLSSNLERRVAKMFERVKSDECRAKIGTALAHYVNAVGKEASLPFVDVKFKNGCYFDGVDYDGDDPDEEQRLFDEVEEKSWNYQPPRHESEYIDDHQNLNILYAILTHGTANETIRLVNALHEDGHTFVIHVDGKELADQTYRELVDFASTRDHVHILPDEFRVRVNWGGFSMVNATLQIMKYAMAVGSTSRPGKEEEEHLRRPLDFHKFVHLAATTYPIKSNKRIRSQLAEYPIDANHLWVMKRPTNPHEDAWLSFVECDDAVHRIHRLPPKRFENAGVDVMTSSQWFVASRDFVRYLAEAKPGSFVHEFLEYAEHIVVADEQFFGTVIRNTEFCHKHENTNFLFLEFGKWENEIHNDTEARDMRKCLVADPNRCGRSPKDVTKGRVMALEFEERKDLFARKFAHEEPAEVKDAVDRLLRDDNARKVDLSFEGQGVLIVAKDTLHEDVPLCLGLGPEGQPSPKAHLMPCFHDWVLETLPEAWHTGGVSLSETPKINKFEIGPCTSDGNLTRMSNGELKVTPGVENPAGPRCLIKINGRKYLHCIETQSVLSENVGRLVSTHCAASWTKAFFFGDGTYAPRLSIHAMVPGEIRNQAKEEGREQEAHICLGVAGRGDRDEEIWSTPEGREAKIAYNPEDKDEYNIDEKASGGATDADENKVQDDWREMIEDIDDVDLANEVRIFAGEEGADHEGFDSTGLLPLHDFRGKEIVTTRCSNIGAVIEWIFVPYILVEDESPSGDTGGMEAADEDDDEEL